MAQDLEATLNTVASMGYTEVEFAGYFDHSPAALARILDDTGLGAPSAHVDPADLSLNAQAVMDQAALIGHRYIVIPWWDESLRTHDGYRQLIDLLNRLGELASERNLKLAYHNHDFEFSPSQGWVPFDLMLQETDPEFVHFELDLYWAARCGRDPVGLFRDNPGRFPLLHAKDMDTAGNETDVGRGVIDFLPTLEAAPLGGVEHLFIERDHPQQPLASAAHGLAQLRQAIAGL